MDTYGYDKLTGLPEDCGYLEKGIPEEMREDIEAMSACWAREDAGETDDHWDIYWCNLQADINEAEVENEISHELADYLRRKYLRLESDI